MVAARTVGQMYANLYLGTNLIKNCDAALIVNGVEVFRLRERTGDGRFVVDFDLRDSEGNRIAKIAKNNVVFAAEGFERVNEASRSFVRDTRSGHIAAMVEELQDGSVKVTGDFWIDGFHVAITQDDLIAGGFAMDHVAIDGFHKAIVLTPGQVNIALAG